MSGGENPRRLREGGDRLAKLLDAAAQDQARGVPGASERVYRGLSGRRSLPRWPLALAAGLAAAAVAAFLLRTPRLVLRESTGAVSGSVDGALTTGHDGAALLERRGLRIALGPDSALQASPLRLLRGQAAFLSTSKFSMQAGALQVEAVQALFAAAVRDRPAIHVRRGFVRAGGALVKEGARWPADAPPPDALSNALADLAADPSRGIRSLAQLETPPAPRAISAPADLLARARDEERAGRYGQAASLFAQLAGGDGAWAGNALYELARLRLRDLDQPAQALQSLLEYRRRFPSGPLEQEVALTSIEARLALHQPDGALADMNAFLDRYGQSERAGEVRWLRASLRLRRGECAAARPDVSLLLPDPRRGDDAAFALAACAQDEERNSAPLRDYLFRFPEGRHRPEARDRLATEPR
ncbi:MAG TPA: hypothetical protein VLW85_21275 [Myxococcales bacterium]|nr:hypothetical protein [Myxococcales bacterium]